MNEAYIKWLDGQLSSGSSGLSLEQAFEAGRFRKLYW